MKNVHVTSRYVDNIKIKEPNYSFFLLPLSICGLRWEICRSGTVLRKQIRQVNGSRYAAVNQTWKKINS